MAQDMERLYARRLKRYITAMQNGRPDRVPIRPFVAEFTAAYAGYTCQDVTQDYEKAFAAVRRCAADFDWDAVVGNMVYVWSGLTEAIGLQYYAVPGIDLSPDTPFQYKEPEEERAFMRPDEYDALIEDPTGYLFNVWLPRVSKDVVPLGQPSTYRNNLSFLKGGMAMLSYFNGLVTDVMNERPFKDIYRLLMVQFFGKRSKNGQIRRSLQVKDPARLFCLVVMLESDVTQQYIREHRVLIQTETRYMPPFFSKILFFPYKLCNRGCAELRLFSPHPLVR